MLHWLQEYLRTLEEAAQMGDIDPQTFAILRDAADQLAALRTARTQPATGHAGYPRRNYTGR